MATILEQLKHADGTAVTAQEAYDAFMNTRVLIAQSEITYEVISMDWRDNNKTQTDPTNVGYVELRYLAGNSGTGTIRISNVGNADLVL